jgi:hypothetical protein
MAPHEPDSGQLFNWLTSGFSGRFRFNMNKSEIRFLLMEKYLGLGGIELIGTDTFKYKDQTAFRYCFQTWKAYNIQENTIETDRFYVWADAVDKAYKIAVDHVYRELNAPYHEAVDAGEGGGRYEVELDEQHREVEVDTEEQWYHLMYGNRDDFYLG